MFANKFANDSSLGVLDWRVNLSRTCVHWALTALFANKFANMFANSPASITPNALPD